MTIQNQTTIAEDQSHEQPFGLQFENQIQVLACSETNPCPTFWPRKNRRTSSCCRMLCTHLGEDSMKLSWARFPRPEEWLGGWFNFISEKPEWIWHDYFVCWEAPYRWRHACLSKLESFLIEERNAGRYHPLISEGLGSWQVAINLPSFLNLEWTQCGWITAFAFTHFCHASDRLWNNNLVLN